VVFLILRALVILEGIGNTLHPEFQSLEYIRPYGVKILAEEYSVGNVNSELSYTLTEFGGLLYNFPSELRYILKKLRKGEFNFDIKIQADETILRKAESITNRLTFTMLICALVISATLSLNANFPDYLKTDGGIPYLSILGYGLSIYLAVLLFLLIVRSNIGGGNK
jgi:ubiquinone biosynthesis protein